MRILLLEDELELQRPLAQALREDGYSVDEATVGEATVFNALTREYAAVILDLMPPRRDGWQVLADLWKQRQTPVLILTAGHVLADAVGKLNPGPHDYLVKPFGLAEMLARLRVLVRRTLRFDAASSSAFAQFAAEGDAVRCQEGREEGCTGGSFGAAGDLTRAWKNCRATSSPLAVNTK